MDNTIIKNIIRSMVFGLTSLAMVGTMASCQDGDWDTPSVTPQTAYGNPAITEHNVITLAQLRNMPSYKSALTAQRGYQLVEDDIQLKLRVTGNDQGGNIYNKVAMQDENGDAIIVTVYAGGLHSYLPVGQQVLIDLKDLYVGTYGYQQQIGVPYTTASGNTYAGRMPNWLWQQHFKLIGTPDPNAPEIQPIEFTDAIKNNIDANTGKLMTIKNVTIQRANGKLSWADINESVQEDEENTEFSTERYINGVDKNVIIYTSTSAKFAAEKIPTTPMNITGIFSRYGTTWQILIRNIDDVQVVK